MHFIMYFKHLPGIIEIKYDLSHYPLVNFCLIFNTFRKKLLNFFAKYHIPKKIFQGNMKFSS